MAQLLVRGLSEETVRRLRERAKAHQRSVEAEHRAILEEVLGEPSTSRDLVVALQDIPWLGELDPAELRDNNPPREFHSDP
jgi:plasmid stability protein